MKFLPQLNLPPAMGSRGRILTLENGHVIWEGKKVVSEDLIPGK